MMKMNLLTDKWIVARNNDNTQCKVSLSELLSGNYAMVEILPGTSDVIKLLTLLLQNSTDHQYELDDLFSLNLKSMVLDKRFPIDQLIYNQPRTNTQKLNKDYFVKRGIKNVCLGCLVPNIFVMNYMFPACVQGFDAGIYANKLIICQNICLFSKWNEQTLKRKVAVELDNKLSIGYSYRHACIEVFSTFMTTELNLDTKKDRGIRESY